MPPKKTSSSSSVSKQAGPSSKASSKQQASSSSGSTSAPSLVASKAAPATVASMVSTSGSSNKTLPPGRSMFKPASKMPTAKKQRKPVSVIDEEMIAIITSPDYDPSDPECPKKLTPEMHERLDKLSRTRGRANTTPAIPGCERISDFRDVNEMYAAVKRNEERARLAMIADRALAEEVKRKRTQASSVTPVENINADKETETGQESPYLEDYTPNLDATMMHSKRQREDDEEAEPEKSAKKQKVTKQ